MRKPYKQVRDSANRKMQAAQDRRAGIDRKKLAMDAAVAAIEAALAKKQVKQ